MFCNKHRAQKHIIDLGLDEASDRHREMQYATNIQGWTEEHFCAYPSIKVMEKWIHNDEISVLIANNYKVIALTIKDSITTPEQVLFKKAEIINTADLTPMYK